MQERGIARSDEILPSKIALVDMEKLITQSKKGDKFEEEFKAYTESVRNALDKIETEIKEKRDGLSRFDRTHKDFAKKASALLELEMSFEVKGKFHQQDFPMRRQRWIEGAFREIIEVINTVAKAKGYDMVLAKEGSKVLYSNDALDITDAVLEVWDTAK